MAWALSNKKEPRSRGRRGPASRQWATPAHSLCGTGQSEAAGQARRPETQAGSSSLEAEFLLLRETSAFTLTAQMRPTETLRGDLLYLQSADRRWKPHRKFLSARPA